jgi:hypothetical protein
MWETKDEVKLAYIVEGQSHFFQTIYTPAMAEWITNLVGFAAEKDAAQDILNGTFDLPSDCDPYLRQFLEAARMPDVIRNVGPISTAITIQDHIKGWRRQKERTASVKSELGFADHIAATYHSGMAEIDRLFRQIPYTVGFSPTSYQKITDFAILKKAGIYDVKLMRTIQLMVAGRQHEQQVHRSSRYAASRGIQHYSSGPSKVSETEACYSSRSKQSVDS